jgi:hypothetical protein
MRWFVSNRYHGGILMLGYRVERPLDLPTEAFSADGSATVVVTGQTVGGKWLMNAVIPQAPTVSFGSFWTDIAPGQPDLAVEAAEDWMRKECDRLDLTLAHSASQNHTYGPDEAPFFAGIMFVVDRRN